MSAVLALFDVLFAPLRLLPPHGALFLCSFLAGGVILLIYRATVSAARMRRINEELIGSMLEIWFARDSLAAVLRAEGRIIRLAILKLLHQWLAILALVLFVGWFLLGLEPYAEFRPLEESEQALLMAPSTVEAPVTGISGEGLEVRSHPVRIPSRGQVAWNVSAARSIDILAQDGRRLGRVSVSGSGALLPADAIRSASGFRVQYPEREWSLFGFTWHWIWWFSLYAILGAGAVALLVPQRQHYGSIEG